MYVYHPFLIFEEDTVDLAYKLGKILGFEDGSKNSLLKFLKEVPATDLVIATKILFDEVKPVSNLLLQFYFNGINSSLSK